MNVLRSVGAVLAGLIFIFISSLLTDVAMHATGIFPPWFEPMSHPLWFLAIGYRIVYGIIGFVLSIVATLPLGLGWLVLGPVIAASVYTAYRDVYLR